VSSNFNAYDYQWGKFGQNLLRNQHEIISDRTRLLEVLNDSDCELISTVVLNENLVRFFSNNVFFQLYIVYKTRKEALEALPNSCLPIAALTTAYARIMLYRAMAKIEPGRLAYVGKWFFCRLKFVQILTASSTRTWATTTLLKVNSEITWAT